jgi:antitoxin ChpS
MMIARFRQVGGSAMVAIPPLLMEQLGLKAGSTVSVEIERGRLVLSSVRRRFTHAELLAMGPPPLVTDEDVAWDTLQPVGSEVI